MSPLETTGSPVVSVLLPAHNAAATLPACLRSLTRQTVTDWACVLVDDGSTDDTAAIARAAARRDPRITVVTTPHRGLVAALDEGLHHCAAPYVARMDADDLMRRTRLADQVQALETQPELTAVGAHVRIFPRQHLHDGWRAYERWLNGLDSAEAVRRDAFVESPVAHPTLMIRRATLERFGYRDRGWAEDYDLILRLLAAGHRVGVVPRRLVAWRDHPDRLTRRAATYAIAQLTACKAAFLASGFLGATERYVLWGYGSTARALDRALRAHGKRAAHVIDVDPRRVGNRIRGAPVVLPDALPTLPRLPVVVSVAGATPRAQIRAFMARHGFEEIRDFVCAA